MKNIKKAFLILMSAVLMIECCGCGIIDFGADDTEIRMNIASDELKKKYGEEFVILNTWSEHSNYFNATCYPLRNPEIVFDGSFYYDGIHDDEYVQGIVGNNLKEKLNIYLDDVFDEYYIHCYALRELKNDLKNIQSITFEEYVNNTIPFANGEHKPDADYIICVNNTYNDTQNYQQEYQKILSSFTLIESETKINAFIQIYFLPDNVYNKCKEYLKRTANTDSTFNDMINGYPINESILVYDDGRCSISEQEYVNYRKREN